ncbi:helix-turn-helix domain-containing protein [Moritella viscosa]|uniref:Transcriptional regulator, XRE family n=1 Tax=Moritella viscosa TaxID=80854 RepID=A0A1L0CDX9_9GAMM|nr:helix-turn-helix transcriptional regulator [Moritella viscosa]SGZ20723.1 Transcriptional regulator, XRE family [Moritella viscosa]SHO15532.1 Transcriptional regulator, XRE family [Moritella viscosa]SHO17669.1 Transcriptional regulator, XRE family [Moritella viscosa]
MVRENPIPARLKQARKKANITQKDLGIKIGMEPSSASGRMNHYEKGRHTPDVTALQRMADELGVPLNYFFCEDDSAAELACLIDKLSEDEKVLLINKLLDRAVE